VFFGYQSILGLQLFQSIKPHRPNKDVYTNSRNTPADLPNSKNTSIVVLVNFYFTQPHALVVCKQVVRVRMCIQKGREEENKEKRELCLSLRSSIGLGERVAKVEM